MQETWVRSLGREDPLEKEMVNHSSILAWRIPWTEKPGRLQSMGSQRVGHDWATSPSPLYIGKEVCMHIYIYLFIYRASLVAQKVKNLPAMQETQVQPLSQEDPLEKGMATHSSILACRISWTEDPGGLQSMESQRVRHDWSTKHTAHTRSEISTFKFHL